MHVLIIVNSIMRRIYFAYVCCKMSAKVNCGWAPQIFAIGFLHVYIIIEIKYNAQYRVFCLNTVVTDSSLARSPIGRFANKLIRDFLKGHFLYNV